MKADRSRQIHFRLSEPLYALIEEKAINDESSVAAVARWALRNQFEPIAAERYQQSGAGTDTNSGADTNTSAAA